MADKLIGPHSHLSYRALLEILPGYLMPMTSVKCIKTSPFCWCQPPVFIHVVHEYWGYKGIVQPQAQSFRDVIKRYVFIWRSIQSAQSPGRPVHSDTNSPSLGNILAMQQLRNDYSLTFPLLYSQVLIFTAE